MRQWEIYDFPFPNAEMPHPCVVISPTRIAEHLGAEGVNILPCQTLRGGHQLLPVEVGLDEDDGLDRRSLVKCQFMFYFRKTDAGRLRGTVGYERQLAIKRALRAVYGL